MQKLLIVAALVWVGTAAQGATPPAPPPTPATSPASPIPYPLALILIRSSLAALQQADETGNYSVLQAVGTQSFRASNPPVKLAQIFASLRPYNISSVLVIEPRFTQVPVLRRDGTLGMAGFFASDGFHINFQLSYTSESGRWHLSQINVGIQSGG